VQPTRLPHGRRLRRILTTSSLTLTMTALGSGAVPLLVPAAAQPHPVRTSVHTISLGAATMAVTRGARVPALPVPTLTAAAADGAAAPAGLRPTVSSGRLSTSGFSVVGVTWDGSVSEGSFAAWVRTRAGGAWTDWSALPQESAEHAPDPGTAEAAHERAGTDPLVVAHSDGVEVRVDTVDGVAPTGLRVDLVEPGTSAADATVGTRPAGAASAAASRPAVLSRAQWGADESLVKDTPGYGTVRGAFVHHTVSANAYSQAEVPGILRGILAYHTRSLGWDDIGYNFLVDRFGRIWEGRGGGTDRAVIGAHTAGHNTEAFAMSAIGTFSTVTPPSAVISAYQRLFAWKFAVHGVDPRKAAYYGGRAYNAISGHRDVYSTQCPGQRLYNLLPAIRSGTIARMGTFPHFDNLAAAGDVDGDGQQDLVANAADGTLYLYRGNRSTGGFRSRIMVGGGWQVYDRLLGVGDWNGDGKDDLVVRDRRNGMLWLYRGTHGTGSRRYAPRVQIGTGFLPYDSMTAAGDVNGDGKPDLVIHDGDGKLRLYPGNGRTGFLSPTIVGTGWWGINAVVGGGDWNGDGKDDLIGRRPDGTLWFYAGPGRPGRGYTRVGQAGSGWQGYDTLVAPGTWTPDNRPDLIGRKASDHSLWLYDGNGRGGILGGRRIGTSW
jgi:hypothetical protein